MKKLRLACILIGCLIASALTVGALAARAEALEPGAFKRITLQVDAPVELTFTPTVNALYGLYLFPEDGAEVSSAQLIFTGGTLSGEGLPQALTARLSADETVRVLLTGTGVVNVEFARETLSRSFAMPLELDDGGSYAKLIARAGDVHWYAFTAQSDGTLLLCTTPAEAELSLESALTDDQGRLLAQSEALDSGACALSAQVEAGKAYRIRISAANGGTGKYLLNALRGETAQPAESVWLSQTSLTLQGYSVSTLHTEAIPADASALILLDSSDPSVVEALPDGTLEGRGAGTATVTAYAYGGARSVCEVTVEPVAAQSLTLTAQTFELVRGDEAQIEAHILPWNALNRKLTYESSDESVVTVDRRGNLSAVGVGAAEITVSIEGEAISATASVTVSPAGRRWRALLIGEQNYASTVETVRLGSANSVESIENLLGLFEDTPYTVRTLMDAPRDDVIAAIRETFADASEEDVSLVYLTCHGFYQAGMTFFVMADGSVLAASDLERELRSIPGRIVVLADCCGSGGLIGRAGSTDDLLDGVTGVFQGSVGSPSISGSKYFVIASALLDQDSYRISFSDGEDGAATVFARALCDAAGWSIDRAAPASMNADFNYDGAITFSELDAYLSRRVRWYLSLAGNQTQTVRVYPEGSDFALLSGMRRR